MAPPPQRTWLSRALRLSALVAVLVAAWQAALVARAIAESRRGFYGLPGVSIEPSGVAVRMHPSPPAADAAPPQIQTLHQIWRTADLSTYPTGAAYADTWRSLCDANAATLRYRLWTDADVDALLASPRYAAHALRAAYRALPPGVKRADLARLLVLHAEGGIYCDLDTDPREHAAVLPSLLAAADAATSAAAGATATAFECVLPLATDSSSVSNHWLVCNRGSPFLEFAMTALAARQLAWWAPLYSLWALPYLDVLATTGPIALSVVLRAYVAARGRSSSGTIALLPPACAGEFVGHAAGRSWHGADGRLLSWFGDGGAERLMQADVLAAAALVGSALVLLAVRTRALRDRCCCCCCCCFRRGGRTRWGRLYT